MNTRSPSATAASRDRILDAALDEFFTAGFHGATMRTIGNRAGCSAANVYNHFENKSDLLVEILRTASDEQFTATRNAIRRAGKDPVEQWRAAVVAHALYTAQKPRECLVANTELRYLGEIDRKRVVARATPRSSSSSTSPKERSTRDYSTSTACTRQSPRSS